MMKMKQTDTSFGRPDLEVFYDGQLRVVYDGTYGVVNIPEKKKHWENELYQRGYRVIEEEAPKVEEPQVEELPQVSETVAAEKVKPAATGRRKAKNG